MKTSRIFAVWGALSLLSAIAAYGQGNNPLVGVWSMDEGFQVTELLFRTDGKYQIDIRSTDPIFGYSSTERGRYTLAGQNLQLTPYDYIGEPQGKTFEFDISAGVMTLERLDFPITEYYQFQTGSLDEVVAMEAVAETLIGAWRREIMFYGTEELTFRPGGYYFSTSIPEGEFPPEIVRGRYERDGANIRLNPYGGVEVEHELDFFGTTLTVIKRSDFSGEALAYELVAGSEAAVMAKAEEAAAFLSRENWQVGVWEIRDAIQTVDLTIRPDGYYIAREDTEFLDGIVRGRWELDAGFIHLQPFTGQGIYAKSNGEFGKVERTRAIDYYDGELQFIDLDAISQSVTIARKQSGSEEMVMQKVQEAAAFRAGPGWYIGIWEVNDPVGWMEFTFRPDDRYIAKAGSGGVPSDVERGQYRFGSNKVTLAPYAGLGSSRGFELDFYDGDLFLVGDTYRMVVARKVEGSEAEVIEKTANPTATLGERGGILGLWTANLPGDSKELVFRDDSQFRLRRCSSETLSHDYGLYSVDMATRKLISDSRFAPVETRGLDFYGETMTIHGGLSHPSSYRVNLGQVNSAIEASFAADAQEALVDATWLARIPVGPRDPNAVQVPTGDIPADPNPGRIFEAPTVFEGYQLYRRLIPGWVYFNVNGTIKGVPVVNTREWHFFPSGRVMVRFRNYFAGVYPDTIEDATISWGAYRVGPKPVLQDILHIYADNELFIETDSGEQTEMTLEDGRRHLFWGKDYQINSQWAAEQKPIPCEASDEVELSLMNTGVDLETDIDPDPVGAPEPFAIGIVRKDDGYAIAGQIGMAGQFALEKAENLTVPVIWETLQTNDIPAGTFELELPEMTGTFACFRLRRL